jgi:hypothetical protein
MSLEALAKSLALLANVLDSLQSVFGDYVAESRRDVCPSIF